ncbi:MAG: hypothetical protein L0Z53_00985 [Acidobacteriales bacterium]|nr:hypothetical protein [Terriglobales bacterium]
MRRLQRLVTLLLCLFAGHAAFAQYFGQNKVRYKSFDFKVLKTPHFDVYYYPEEADAAVEVGRMSERWYARLSRIFDHQLSSRQPLILYASPPDFRSTTVFPDFIGEGTGGVTEPIKRRVVMPLAGPFAETDHVLGHELVHAFQYDISTHYTAVGGEAPGVAVLPLWFVEGMAEYLSLGPVDTHTAMWLRDAVEREKLPRIKDLDNPKYFPYRWGQAFWAYVTGRFGDQAVARMMKSARRGAEPKSLIQNILGISEETLSQDWHRAMRDQYQPVLRATTPADQQGRLLVSKKRHGGELNVSPALSPDGKQMVFISSKELFSVDLYLADAESGEIKRKLTKTAVDPHLDSLGFVNSAGAWSFDGSKFAFGDIRSGRPEIAVYDVASGKVSGRIRLRELGEISNVTWSPDGREIAFSAIKNGMTDLFVVEVASKKIRQLTNDMFADIQPAWSPDGRRIAFVTDRFTSNADELQFGAYRLAMLDPRTQSIEPLRTFNTGKQINPQWSADGRNLFFVSDRDGISNIYRISVASGDLAQVTNLRIGTTGITSLSPAISAAANSPKLVYSTFAAGDYEILSLDSSAALAGTAPTTALRGLAANTLPPLERTSNAVLALLKQPELGLTRTREFKTTNYKAKLGLDYVAPPSLGVGVSNYGSLIGGGTALYFSDLLGFHNVVTTIQTFSATEGSSFVRNLSGLVGYQNQKSRWTWGFLGGQVPYISGGFAQGLSTIGGEPVLVEQDILTWQINRQLTGIAAYPFNRAQRVEFAAGYQNVGFAAEANTRAFSLNTGELLVDERTDLPTPDPLHMAVSSAALVYDTSIFGGVSPIVGQSYRFEVGGTAGSLSYGTALADYRRYFRIARPLTIGGRLLHFGRYGGGSQDPRLQDLFIGYPSLVRGYDTGSFDARECGPQLGVTGACPVFDQLLGSRVAVANVETRTPLLGRLGIIPSRPVPPAELVFFFDAGYAWKSVQAANLVGYNPDVVRSTGTSLRFNILGFAIGQVSYVHPLDRPFKKWLWQFSLAPGF